MKIFIINIIIWHFNNNFIVCILLQSFLLFLEIINTTLSVIWDAMDLLILFLILLILYVFKSILNMYIYYTTYINFVCILLKIAADSASIKHDILANIQ